MKQLTLRNLMQTRGVRYGGYASLITLAVVVGIIVVNLIVGQLGVQADLTSSSLYTLSDQTKNVLKKLKEDVTIYALYPHGGEQKEVMEGLQRYSAASSHVKIDVVDPEQNPGFVKKYDKSGNGIPNGSLIVVGPKDSRVIKQSELFSIDYRNPQNPQVLGLNVEKTVTNALLYVTTGVTPVIYELTGHREYSLGNLGIADNVKQENFDIKTLNLLQTGKVPSDAAILVIANPTIDLAPGEVQAIKAYLENNGHLFVMQDVGPESLPNLNGLLSYYGVEYQNGFVVEEDPNHYVANNNVQLMPVLEDQDILKPIKQAGTPIILPYSSQGIKESQLKTRDVQVTPLLESSAKSFLRTDLNSQSRNKIASDVNGPITLAVAINNKMVLPDAPQFRLIVMGTARFLQSVAPYGTIPGNLDFFLNGLSWLEHRTDTISIRTKTVLQFPMRLTGVQVLIFSLLFVVVIPLIIMISGLVVWLRRRHL